MSEVTITVNDYKSAGESLKRIQELLFKGLQAGAVLITFSRERRTTDQNAKIWPMFSDISKQVVWFERKHSPEVWKEITSGSFCNCEFVPNIENTGFVMIGQSTSKFTKVQCSAYIEYLYAFGAEKEVQWSDKSLEIYEQYRESTTTEKQQ